uniref:ABC transporter domain-containing protein n=1 Tax=Arcella intermedia TaxID=1963864 RepID=A0A6B2L9R1_9EUKA
MITFQLYWNMLRSSYGSLVENITSFTKAGGAAQRVIALLDNLPDINPDEGEQVEEVKGDIELRDVEYYYQMRPDIKVLKGINLNIKSGQVCALVGKSGSGKSTMIHLLMRFYDPKSGGILLDGKDYRQLNPISLRKHIGIVAQDTELFNLTIEENIAYGVEDNYTKEELYQAAKLANAHDFITEFDEGYETRVGEGGLRLSGGQKQRIALARVFLRKPKLLFLDEATSALDSESEAAVQEAIDTLISLGGCTVVLVAHRLSTVINADLIGVVHEGRIVELGTHNELLKKKGIYEKLVKRQVARMANTIQESEKDKQVDIIDTLIEQMNV